MGGVADFHQLPRRDYILQPSLQIWTLNKDTAYVANQTDEVTLKYSGFTFNIKLIICSNPFNLFSPLLSILEKVKQLDPNTTRPQSLLLQNIEKILSLILLI